jgi:hypothetical protein
VGTIAAIEVWYTRCLDKIADGPPVPLRFAGDLKERKSLFVILD